jgi:pyruvate/2-oxoglutarate/acetoin dehydrogenase E1 component
VLVTEDLAFYKENGLVSDDAEFLTAIGEANVAREGSDLIIRLALLCDRACIARGRATASEHHAQAEMVGLRSLRRSTWRP